MINVAEAEVIGQVAGPGILFPVPGSKDRAGNQMVVLKVPVMVNPRRRKKAADGSNLANQGKAYTIAIWGAARVSNYLKHCPPGTQIRVRGTLNHDGRKDPETGKWTQYASINAIDLDFGMRSQKGMALAENTYYIFDGKGERIKKTVALVPIPANARASAQPEHQVSSVPASVDALADLVNNATGGTGGFELQTA